MIERSRKLGTAYDRVARATNRVQLLHGLAFVAVSFAFLIDRTIGRASCFKTCGIFELVESCVAWWPVALSWLVLRNSQVVIASAWQVMFLCVNVAVSAVYLASPWDSFFSYGLLSLAHGGVLLLMAVSVLGSKGEPNVSPGA